MRCGGVRMSKETRFALKHTVPVLVGYLFLGIAFGLMLQNAGYHFLWALLISTVVYAGSMQFVLLSMLIAGVDPATAAAMTLSVNSRHFFYGLSCIDIFRNMGKRAGYMIFSLTDETFALLATVKIPDQLDRKKTIFRIALFNHLYWILGSVTGAIGGDVLTLNLTGIDFAMTALFVVLFMEQIISAPGKRRIPAVIGLGSGIVMLILLGPDRFILPSLVLAVGLLIVTRPVIQKTRK